MILLFLACLVKKTNPEEVVGNEAFYVGSDASVDAYEHGLAAIAYDFLEISQRVLFSRKH